MGTKLMFFSAFYPQMDGQIEVTNRSLGNLLRCLVADQVTSCDTVLPHAKFSFSNSVNRSTGCTPFEVVYGFSKCQTLGSTVQEGDLVLVRLKPERFPPVSFMKLQAHRAGPFQVTKKLGGNAYVIKLPFDFGISHVFNIEDLTEF
ncbi:uncharacterized protein LOC141685770 [Apium graveolens]|uniref:uncharacterized protein LOC141685770 n=1 Tax=Apium graveolens TaxID=4045 RepID=UPI003D793800